MRAFPVAIVLSLASFSACASKSPEPVAPTTSSPPAVAAPSEQPSAAPTEVATGEAPCPNVPSSSQAECSTPESAADAGASLSPEVDSSTAAVPAPPVTLPPGRDPRGFAKHPRALALLVTEIQALEQLYAATPKTAPDRPALMRRLAESYDELQYAAAGQANGPKVVLAARSHAIKYYRMLESDYPSYAGLDSVYYFAGYDYERGGDLSNARAQYRELSQRFPSSPYASRAP